MCRGGLCTGTAGVFHKFLTGYPQAKRGGRGLGGQMIFRPRGREEGRGARKGGGGEPGAQSRGRRPRASYARPARVRRAQRPRKSRAGAAAPAADPRVLRASGASTASDPGASREAAGEEGGGGRSEGRGEGRESYERPERAQRAIRRLTVRRAGESHEPGKVTAAGSPDDGGVRGAVDRRATGRGGQGAAKSGAARTAAQLARMAPAHRRCAQEKCRARTARPVRDAASEGRVLDACRPALGLRRRQDGGATGQDGADRWGGREPRATRGQAQGRPAASTASAGRAAAQAARGGQGEGPGGSPCRAGRAAPGTPASDNRALWNRAYGMSALRANGAIHKARLSDAGVRRRAQDARAGLLGCAQPRKRGGDLRACSGRAGRAPLKTGAGGALRPAGAGAGGQRAVADGGGAR